MERLGKNISSYAGPTIEIWNVLGEIERLALASGWEPIPLRISEGKLLPAFCRPVANPLKRIYISSGIHGDEPGGPLAILQLFQENKWPADIAIWLVPCLNPGGFEANRRENEEGIDLNRDYRAFKSAAIRAHAQWLETCPQFDLGMCLHEDWEAHGFYLYELNPDLQPSCAEQVIKRVSQVCPVDLSPVIEGRNASGGVICANPDLMKRPDWPEAFYLVHHKTRLNYTFEAPSDFPMETRTNALVTAVRTIFDFLK
jgi:hypothetical protein